MTPLRIPTVAQPAHAFLMEAHALLGRTYGHADEKRCLDRARRIGLVLEAHAKETAAAAMRHTQDERMLKLSAETGQVKHAQVMRHAQDELMWKLQAETGRGGAPHPDWAYGTHMTDPAVQNNPNHWRREGATVFRGPSRLHPGDAWWWSIGGEGVETYYARDAMIDADAARGAAS